MLVNSFTFISSTEKEKEMKKKLKEAKKYLEAHARKETHKLPPGIEPVKNACFCVFGPYMDGCDGS